MSTPKISRKEIQNKIQDAKISHMAVQLAARKYTRELLPQLNSDLEIGLTLVCLTELFKGGKAHKKALITKCQAAAAADDGSAIIPSYLVKFIDWVTSECERLQLVTIIDDSNYERHPLLTKSLELFEPRTSDIEYEPIHVSTQDIEKYLKRRSRVIENPSLIAKACTRLSSVGYRLDPFIFECIKALRTQTAKYELDDHKDLIKSLYAQACKVDVSKEAFYIPHMPDHRGRIYGQTMLAATSSGYSKALLRFAHAEPITNEQFVTDMLLLQISDCLKDKGSALARIDRASKWLCKDKTDWNDRKDIFAKHGASANTLMLAGYVREYYAIVVDGKRFTDIVCYQDATQSGAQHIAALTRDTKLANLTNINGGDYTTKPKDLYGEVAKKMNLLGETDKFDRNQLKAPVMVMMYGAGTTTLGSHFEDEEELNLFFTAIREVAPSIMSYLNAVQDVVDNTSLTYMLGETVYHVKELTRDQINFGGYHCYLDRTKPELNINKMRTSIAPNLIHSIDAWLVQRVITNSDRCFVNIHDSFGCHATRYEAMNQDIRSEFFKLHGEIGNLNDLLAQMNPDVCVDIKKYKLNRVLESVNMFC